MPTNYDKVDLKFSWNGDYGLGSDGDLDDTYSDQIQSLVQEIQTVVASVAGDWEENPLLGADLDLFVGEANTRTTAENIRAKVVDALTSAKVVKNQDLAVRVIPVGIHSVLILIQVQALATAANSLEGNSVSVTVVFDYVERGLYFIEGVES